VKITDTSKLCCTVDNSNQLAIFAYSHAEQTTHWVHPKTGRRKIVPDGKVLL